MNQIIRVVKINSNNPNKITKVNEEGEIIANTISEESFNGYLNKSEINKMSIIDGWYFTRIRVFLIKMETCMSQEGLMT